MKDKEFKNLTTLIKGKTIKEQPIEGWDGRSDKTFFILLYDDGTYSVVGEGTNKLGLEFCKTEDLTQEMKNILYKAKKAGFIKEL